MVDNDHIYSENQLSAVETALVDELILNRIPLPEIVNEDTLKEALDATKSSDYLSFI